MPSVLDMKVREIVKKPRVSEKACLGFGQYPSKRESVGKVKLF